MIEDLQNYGLGNASKVYTANEIWTGSFLGGPLVAGYMISENFKAFGEDDKTSATWIITAITTIIILGLAYLIGESDKFPRIIMPLGYTGIAYLVVRKYQLKNIEDHTKHDGEYYDWGRVILISIIGLLITFLLILVMIYFIDYN